MGECIHDAKVRGIGDVDDELDLEYYCTKCPKVGHGVKILPHLYCSSLDAVRKVEEKVIEKVGLSEYCLYLQAPPSAIIATAEQRARACKAAIDAYTKLTGRI